MAKTILVTGGSGFIGSNFIRYLLKKRSKIKVINLDKLTYSGNPDNLKDIEKDPRYKFIKGDICDQPLVSFVMKKCDYVAHFAAESHVDRSIRNPNDFIRTNVIGTQVLLNEAKRNKIRKFLQVSTDEVYGSIIKGYADEESQIKTNSPYSASKAAADLLARSYFVTYGLPVVITRSSNNFGPYQYPEKIVPLFITNALDDKEVPLYGDGLNERDWIYVLDNCDALLYVLENGESGEVYNIGGGNQLRNLFLTRTILKILGKSEKLIKMVKDRPGHDRRYALDSYKLYRLGWRPISGDFRKKLEFTVSWYANNRKWWEKLVGTRC